MLPIYITDDGPHDGRGKLDLVGPKLKNGALFTTNNGTIDGSSTLAKRIHRYCQASLEEMNFWKETDGLVAMRV